MQLPAHCTLIAGVRSILKFNQQEVFEMADREMIAATLAAALLVGKTFTGSRVTAEEQAVATYRRMLIALDANRDSPTAKTA